MTAVQSGRSGEPVFWHNTCCVSRIASEFTSGREVGRKYLSENDTDVSNLTAVAAFDANNNADCRSALPLPVGSVRIAMDVYCLIEIIAVLVCGVLSGEFYVRNVLMASDYLDSYIWPLLILPLTMGGILYRSELYRVEALSDFPQNARRAVTGLVCAFLAVALLGVIFGVTGNYSRVWFGSWLGLSVVALFVLRVFAARVFSDWIRSGLLNRNIAILGSGRPLKDLLEQIKTETGGTRIAGIFESGIDQTGNTKRNGLDALLDHMRIDPPDIVLIALPDDDRDQLEQAVNALGVFGAEVKFFLAFDSAAIPLRGVSSQGAARFADIQRKSVSDWGGVAKRLEDYSIAIVSLVMLFPLLLLIAVAIKLESRGPVLFKQVRNGLNNNTFEVLKFRTMCVDETDRNFRQAQRNDARVTRVGRFLRRTSLDEIPQLINVLRGEMSIVGPRPHPVDLNRAHASRLPLYNKRHSVRPGITGWAQVNDHRGPTQTLEDMRKRLDCDLYYIDNWSIWLDLSIIAATPFIAIVHKNAV